MTFPTVTWKTFALAAILCLGAPGAAVYSDSVLAFLSKLLGIIGEHAQTIAALVGL